MWKSPRKPNPLTQYFSVKGKRGRGKGKEKTFNPTPVTFSPNQILSSKCLTE
ncbi:hypothetical protein GXM_02365 [Nostoc sphaeroides CCNUC1]|uniref:Uncharacterized protein n=1 Tax=Nostoc sphaeroides CCNUC1 TaxID=2653204 RepID=A0A5P8VWY4_9NOSO|nr:hypothetical protein GXM_02365 [Nostoc sphaeroides CCNUC1]